MTTIYDVVNLHTFFFVADVNECNTGIAVCPEICTNSQGYYMCSCYDGSKLQEDRTSCEGKIMVMSYGVQQYFSYIMAISFIGGENH